ncbi:MAG: YbaN family protein [Anaerolineaceae bacterium]
MQNEPVNIKKIVYIGLGLFFVALGAIGAVLPVMPTTVFLLLAAYFFGRSSDRLYGWLIRSRWLGDYIRHYREGTGITRRKKIETIVLLWISLTLGAIFVMHTWWGRGLLLAVAIGVSWHILAIKTAVEAEKTVEAGCLPGEDCL